MSKPMDSTDRVISLHDPFRDHASPYIIDFVVGDPEDPLNWSSGQKWSITMVVAALVVVVQISTIIAAPVSPQILRSFNSSNESYGTLMTTIWIVGELVGPLIYGPLSETIGRAHTIHITNVISVAFSIGTAEANSIQILIAFRLLNGLSISSTTLAAGIVGDLFAKDSRSVPLSIMMFAGQIGQAIGPIASSYLAEAYGWRWAFRLPTILLACMTVIVFLVYKETYRVKILDSRAWKMNRNNRNTGFVSRYKLEDGHGKGKMAKTALRPFYLLFKSAVLACITFYVGVSCAFYYLILTQLAVVYQSRYDFSTGAAGVTYLCLFVGTMIGFACDTIAHKFLQRKATNRTRSPEQHLIETFVSGVAIACGYLVFGWSIEFHVHWMASIIGGGLVGFGWFLCTISSRAYIVNMFGIYGVSAVAALLIVRNGTAAALPLMGPPLFARIGYGWGCTVICFISLVMLPIPVVLYVYGPRIRAAGTLKILD